MLLRRQSLADLFDVAMIGAATTADHVQIVELGPQLTALKAKLHRIAVIEFFSLIKLGMAHSGCIGA